MRRDVFQAIADPNRRAIIHLLASQEKMTVNDVTAHFNISRPAISKHMKILEECGLILIKPVGRERYCEAQLKPLKEVSKWTEQYQSFWTKSWTHWAVFLKHHPPKKRKQFRQLLQKLQNETAATCDRTNV